MTPVGYAMRSPVPIGVALDAFFLEHRRYGELDGGVEEGRVWMTCDCGAGLSRSLLRALIDSRP